MNEEVLSEAWRASSLRYVKALNEFIARGRRDGWDNAGPEPKDDRGQIALAVIEAVRNANRAGSHRHLRTAFPPAWEPFVPLLEEKGQSLEPLQWIDDSRLALHVGSLHEAGRLFVVSEEDVSEQQGIRNFGRSPCGTFCVWVTEQGLEIRRGWGGPVTARIPLRADESVSSASSDGPSLSEAAVANQLIVFPDGQKVLLAGSAGIFVLSPDNVVPLMPSAEELVQLKSEGLSGELSMPHAAISANGELILAGSQDSPHQVFDSRLRPIASIGPHSEYPHFAWFSADGTVAAFNACHFYNGTTIGVRTADLEGLKTAPHENDSRIRVLEDGSRVYAAAARDDELIIGNANGYIRAFDLDGRFRWEHFIGSTINALALSPDRRRLAVTSFAGFCCVLELDTAGSDPFAIGVGAQRELWRWVFWKGEERPLRW